jgi:hypothetical protein
MLAKRSRRRRARPHGGRRRVEHGLDHAPDDPQRRADDVAEHGQPVKQDEGAASTTTTTSR